ncbi:MAG: hypothetical protein ABIH59_02520 [archaeon]
MARKTKAELFDELIIKGQSCSKTKKCKEIEENKVIAYFVSEVHKWGGGGGYIPCSEDYNGKKVYVVVLKEKAK